MSTKTTTKTIYVWAESMGDAMDGNYFLEMHDNRPPECNKKFRATFEAVAPEEPESFRGIGKPWAKIVANVEPEEKGVRFYVWNNPQLMNTYPEVVVIKAHEHSGEAYSPTRLELLSGKLNIDRCVRDGWREITQAQAAAMLVPAPPEGAGR